MKVPKFKTEEERKAYVRGRMDERQMWSDTFEDSLRQMQKDSKKVDEYIKTGTVRNG